MERDIQQCDFITAFNMSWDIDAINNLCKIATETIKGTTINISLQTSFENPLTVHNLSDNHIDLMVIAYKIFWNELHNSTPQQNKWGGTGIFTVSNMHKTLCSYQTQSLLHNNKTTFQFNSPQDSQFTLPQDSQFNSPQFNSPQFNSPQFNSPQFTLPQDSQFTSSQPITTQQQKHLAEYDVNMELDILSTVLNSFQNANELETYISRKKGKNNLGLITPFWNKLNDKPLNTLSIKIR
jgi:hypothetical protein